MAADDWKNRGRGSYRRRILKRYIHMMRLIVTNDSLSVTDIAKLVHASPGMISLDLKLMEKEIPEVKSSIVNYKNECGVGCTHKKIYRWVS